ncbi:spore coat protein [Salinicoccus hispanicus]|uniref:Spore coat protein n=1 Tax=Salinicoccus hispanicus TaxID=157225 RepID=A0A6N8TZC6_9STAP|nr:spore coat protein [Salinicoccus hispanicus]MXQ50913.1 spore coat protein [Salinicoccus hispanicus]
MELDSILKNSGLKTDELIATELLVSSKATVRAYAVALTETVNPEIRDMLKRQMTQALNQHARITDYMVANGMHHPFDLEKQAKKHKKKLKKTRKILAKSEQPKSHNFRMDRRRIET